mgnify:CR=1 FL=1
MINLEYLNFLENILTDNRKAKFLKVLENRTKHFTVVVEDVFQMHNASAVMRSCEVFGIQEKNVMVKVLIRKLRWEPKNGWILTNSIMFPIVLKP